VFVIFDDLTLGLPPVPILPGCPDF